MHLSKTQELTLDEFKKIYDRLYNPLCLFAYRYVNDLDLSEDIVQNVFIKVWEDKISFQNKKKIDGFFYTAVRNKSLDSLRSKYAKDFIACPSEDLEILQTENYYIKETLIIDTSTIIQKGINSLPKKCREVIRFSIEDYTNKEIANEMKLSLGTVKKHKEIGYKKLRKLFAYLRIE